jgi:hypothetical protein
MSDYQAAGSDLEGKIFSYKNDSSFNLSYHSSPALSCPDHSKLKISIIN